ncbi:MAG: NAD-dependent deacylase [Bacteroidetes bacterium]|nr:NAD-dependent deacylase [Bacteroidota bacterium]
MSKPIFVVLSGAGISAESGLRTFRDSGGLWEGYRVEDVATPGAWRNNPSLVLDFYNQRRRDVVAATPNRAHSLLAMLERDFELRIVTQNIDDLHERAGSTQVLHLHGEIFKMRSDRQPQDTTETRAILTDMIPGALAPDGGYWRPHIVWFEEAVPAIEEAVQIMRTAEHFLLVGSSMQVYPAAGLLDFVPSSATRYVIDKNIPGLHRAHRFIAFEKPATEGMEELFTQLRASA